MANICENSMRVFGSEKNLEYIHEFFEDWEYSDVDWYEDEFNRASKKSHR